jgi:hypothetical protein
MNFDFAEKEDTETKRAAAMSATKVDAIGWDLLQETPLQLNYLVGAIRADSLKTLERKSADHARTLQAQAIERTKEASRLLNMPKGESTNKDQKIIEERANKLLSEADVLYRRSAMAAGQAELLRTRRMEAEKDLSLASEDLTKREMAALNQLLLAPGYNIVSSKPEVETAQTEVEQEEPERPVTEEETAEAEQPETEKTLPVEEVSRERTPVTDFAEDADLSEVKGTWLSMVEVIAEKSDFSDVEETMFAEAATSLYSEKNPIPIDPAMPDGLIFQVQVGAYRNPIPQDLFGAYAPLMGQRLDNGIVRYRAGLFKKYKQALQARNEIREKGYSDAFVVAYVDGERLTGAQARAILQQARESENIDTGLLAGASEPEATAQAETPDSPETQPKADYYNDPEAAEAEQVEVIKGLFYTVQVGVYSKPVKLAQLYNLTELNSELTEGGFIRYTTGRFANLNEANTRKNIARDKGVNDAFITAYYNGKRINLEEAEALLQANGRQVLIGAEVEETSKDETPVRTYVVVMGNFAGDVPQELADLFLEKKDWGIRKVEAGGMSMYVSRELESRAEAEKLLEECKRFNIKTAVIGEMVDGKIVSTSVK